jgi:PhnB protein
MNPVSLFLYTENVDAMFNRAVSAAQSGHAADGSILGRSLRQVTDPFGHHWGLAQHVEDVAPDEMQRRSEEWTAKMAKVAGQS